MRVGIANKLAFGTGLAGIALLKKERVTFTLSGSMVDGRETTRFVAAPSTPFVSDAQYALTGGRNEGPHPWAFAPRRFYFIDEAALPSPRVYLYKKNTPTGVEIKLRETTLNGTVAISRTYNVHVDVWIFVSHFL
jgi:hypothetical protein